jgi:hypothetical protein
MIHPDMVLWRRAEWLLVFLALRTLVLVVSMCVTKEKTAPVFAAIRLLPATNIV